MPATSVGRLIFRIVHVANSGSSVVRSSAESCSKLSDERLAPFARLSERSLFAGWTKNVDTAQRSGTEGQSSAETSEVAAEEKTPGGEDQVALSSLERQRRQYTASTSAASTLASTKSAYGATGVPGKKYRYPQPQNAPQPPWTPTQQLKKRKTLPKRMGFMMEVLEKELVEKQQQQKKHPDFIAGDVLELKLAVPENKGRPTTFRGLCIARYNRGIRSSFTLRNHMGTVGAVERSFPLWSPTVQSIRILQRRKVRRAKLYYLRGRNAKEYSVS